MWFATGSEFGGPTQLSRLKQSQILFAFRGCHSVAIGLMWNRLSLMANSVPTSKGPMPTPDLLPRRYLRSSPVGPFMARYSNSPIISGSIDPTRAISVREIDMG